MPRKFICALRENSSLFHHICGQRISTLPRVDMKAPARGPTGDKNLEWAYGDRNLAAPTQRRASTVSPKLSIPFPPGGQSSKETIPTPSPHSCEVMALRVRRIGRKRPQKSVFMMRESWGHGNVDLSGGLQSDHAHSFGFTLFVCTS